uniref:ISXO2-like transposase domain-containing protein n=1 Tax=Homalodisca liturata TaxID=320908 RepID=A0A1B6IY05_9HEMI
MCEECDVGLTESLNLDNDLIIDFLVEHQVFKPEINCPECTSLIKLNRESLNYYCFKLENTGDEKRNCSKEISARVNTIFESCNVDINVYWQFITLLLHLRPPRYELFREELGLSNRLINDLCLYSRDVLIRDCLEKSEKLGGNSKCVEVESSLDKSKSKHSNTHNLALSGMEIESKKSFFVVIINPEPANILAVLKKWILPNTTVVTDCSKIYICLDDEQFREYTIESSVNFVKPEMFNQFDKSMARTWREVSLSSTPSCKSNFSGLLGEYQFKRKYTRLQRLHHFFKAAGHLNQHSTEQESGSMES